jgi:hypothetical protein
MSKRLTYEHVKETIEKIDGYKLLSTEYINCDTKIKIKCPKNHEFNIRYNDFRRKHKCPICSLNTLGDDKRLTYDFVKEQFKKYGYELISTEYKNVRSMLSVKCPKGHIFNITYANFYSGWRCSYCYINKKKTYDYVKSFIEKEGYILLSTEYINCGSKIKIKCPEGHIWETSYKSFRAGYRCIHCSHINGGSTPEKEVLKYIQELYKGEIKQNCRSVIRNYWTNRPLELDIFMPKLNKAVEYGAEYYHRNEYTKWKDMMKIKQCEKKGISLLVIDDIEWRKNRDNCKNKIKNWIGVNLC